MKRNFSLNQTKDFLERIKKHLYRLDYISLKVALDEHIHSLPIIVTPYDGIPQFKEGGIYKDKSLLYRARPNERKFKSASEGMLAPWEHINEISIIPDLKKHLIKRGRLNQPEQSIYYGSNDYHIGCYESISKGFPLKSLGTSITLTVGSWRIQKPLNLARLFYPIDGLNYFKQHDEELYSSMLEFRDKDRSEIIKIVEKDLAGEELEKAILFLDFFSNEVGRMDHDGEYDYFLSNYFAEHVFDRVKRENNDKDIDGILYPSVPFSYQGKNVALVKSALNKLKFIEAMFVCIVYHKSSGNMEFIPLEQGVFPEDNGQLNWKKFKE